MINLASDKSKNLDEAVENEESQSLNLLATRSIEPQYVRPGGSISVTVSVQADRDRFLLQEKFDEGNVAIDTVSPEPVELVDQPGELYAIFEVENPATATVQYDIMLSEEIADGQYSLGAGNYLSASSESRCRPSVVHHTPQRTLDPLKRTERQ